VFGSGDSCNITLDVPSNDGQTALLKLEMRNADGEMTASIRYTAPLSNERKTVVSVVPDSDYTVFSTSVPRRSGGGLQPDPTLHAVSISTVFRCAMRTGSEVHFRCCPEGASPDEPNFVLVYPRSIDLAGDQVSLWAQSVGRPIEVLWPDDSVHYRAVPVHPEGFEPTL